MSTPAFLMYFGENGYITEDSMKDMHRTLQRKGVDVSLVVLPGYSMQRTDHEARPLALEAISEFIDAHL